MTLPKKLLRLLYFLCFFSIVIYWLFWPNMENGTEHFIQKHNSEGISEHMSSFPTVHMGAVTTGEKFADKSLQLIKNILLFTRASLHWYVFTTDASAEFMMNMTESWPDAFKKRLLIIKPTLGCSKWCDYIHDYHPSGSHLKECVFSGIENMNLTSHTNKLIFVDLDIFVVDDIINLWNFFPIFNDHHIMAMSRADLRYFMSNYSQYMFDKLYGANTGVILMFLSHIPGFNFEEKYIEASKDHTYYEKNPERPIRHIDDQNIMNAVFYKYPHKLLTLGCKWNYRGSMDHICSPGHPFHCNEANSQGVSLIHAYSDAFFPKSHYSGVYNCVLNLDMSRVEDTVQCIRKGIEYFKFQRNRSCQVQLNNLQPLELTLDKYYPLL